MTFNSDEAEKAIIGGILFDNSAMPRVTKHLESHEDFFNPAFRLIFKTMFDLSEKGLTVDMMTLQDADSGINLDLLGEALEHCPSSANISVHAEIVHKHYLRRCLHSKLRTLEQSCLEGVEISDLLIDLEDFVSGFVLTKATNVVKADKFGMDVVENFCDRITATKKGLPASGITTGFKALDDFMGGFRRKELFVVGARPSVGKTYFMVNSAIETVESGCRVGIWSLEMAGDAISERFACNLEGLNGEVVRTGYFFGDHQEIDYKKRLVRGLGTLANHNIWFYDKHPNIDIVIESMKDAKRKHDLDVIFIDHLQEITGSLKDSKLAYHQQVGNSVNKIRNFAKATNTAVVLFVQINRSSENHPPQLNNLKDSGKIEELADEALLLHRDFLGDEGVIQAHLAKNRHGAKGNFLIKFKPEISKLEEITNKPNWED